jgi:hypothetical protein
MKTKLRDRKLKSHIHRKGKPPSRACKSMHCQAAVEHVFGAQANDMGGCLVRTIGLVWARARIGMKTSPTPCAAFAGCAVSTQIQREKRFAKDADHVVQHEKRSGNRQRIISPDAKPGS